VADLEMLRLFVGEKLADIADGLPHEYRLTMVARHTGGIDADIVVTDDDLKSAASAIQALARREGGSK